MKSTTSFLILLILLSSCTNNKSSKNTESTQPNILLLCVDDLRPELNCYGKEYIHSPNIDELSANGLTFNYHYVNAPSCGPSRYTLLTGKYGPGKNNALFLRSADFDRNPEAIDPSMPQWFREHGYTTVSVGKVSHHPGGRGGKNWNDDTKIEVPLAWDKHLMPVGEWQHPRGAMHGLSNGEIHKKAYKMDVYQSTAGHDTIYPDGLIAREGIKQLQELSSTSEPFFLSIGLIKPHLPFGAPKKFKDLYSDIQLPPISHPEKPKGQTTWHGSGEFMKYNRWGKDPREDLAFADSLRQHYMACVSYADHHIGMIMDELRKSGADKNTIVILWGDHGWHLGEHAIWGKHSLFEESLHSPLIIHYPEMTTKGAKTDAVVETLDLFPTLCDLTGIEKPEFINGVSLKPILKDPATEGHNALGYWGGNFTLRTPEYRIILHKNGFVELYDHQKDPGETENIAEENEEIVEVLLDSLNNKRLKMFEIGTLFPAQ